MSFKSLNHILGAIEKQPGSSQLFQYQCLLKCWAEVVGAAVAAQTRPIGIGRGVLSVATSSSVWAQELTYRRCLILEKLNAQLPSPLTDIRFSTAQWQLNRTSVLPSSSEHPSRLARSKPLSKASLSANDPQLAFQNWAEMMRSRSQQLPLCSQCHCATPPGEIQRWGICALCATKQWQS